MTAEDPAALVERVVAGEHRALARAITRIENRSPGYRELVAGLHRHGGAATVLGVTGSPGSGKSTLVDRLAAAYRERGETVGVVAVDPSSPFSGGAVLGDRVRMGRTRGDMDVFVRSMSARGSLGGLSPATADAVTALSAFGKDRVVVETVGAGQSEVDVVTTADTVAVLVPPASGDDVQMLKAGILEIGDVFVVNKADREGADRTVAEVEEMLAMRDADADAWTPRVVETVATTGEGVDDFLAAVEAHLAYLRESGAGGDRERERYAEAIRTRLREDAGALLADELDRLGGVDALAERVAARETDPYTVADEVLEPLRDCLDARRPDAAESDPED